MIRVDKIKDVPDVAGEWCQEIVAWAAITPGPVPDAQQRGRPSALGPVVPRGASTGHHVTVSMRRAGLLLTAAIIGVSACESSTPSATPPSAVAPSPLPAASAPAAPAPSSDAPFAPSTASAAPGGHEVTVEGKKIGGVAPGLDLPPGSKVTDSIVTGESTTIILAAPKPAVVLAHYRSKGPAAGYQVGGDTGGRLALTGRGWSVTVTTQAKDSTLSFNPIPAGDPSDPVTPGI